MVETIKVWSEVLNTTILLKVVVPDRVSSQKLMILLHGKMEPELSTELLELLPQELALEELSNEFGMAVVLPLMENRYYISTKDYDCNRFVSWELPNLVMNKYDISDSVEQILAGVSMGGFGATLIGARTGAFQKIISISGAYIANDVKIGNPEVWGNLLPNSQRLNKSFLYYFLPLEDLEQSIDRNALAALPLFQKDKTVIVATCGTKDWLYPRNLKLVEEMENNRLQFKFYPLENGDHEAECFKDGLRKAIEYLEALE